MVRPLNGESHAESSSFCFKILDAYLPRIPVENVNELMGTWIAVRYKPKNGMRTEEKNIQSTGDFPPRHSSESQNSLLREW